MLQTELNEILAAHKRWLNQEEGWTENDRAILRGVDLRNADLCNANLRGAVLYDVDLRANLCGANLYEAYLRNVNLCNANLSEANLSEANLCNANLCGANLLEANLCGTIMCGTVLRDAILCGARLFGANLRDADLCGANLHGADLRGADLCGAKNIPFIPMACPDTGAFIGWKKALLENEDESIIKLLIPDDAKRSSGTSRKCRCNKAVVLEIWDINPVTMTLGKRHKKAVSKVDNKFIYMEGETIVPKSPFDEDRWKECASGIHFFINMQEAIEY